MKRTTPAEQEILKADIGFRKKLIIVFALALAAGGVIIQWILPEFSKYLETVSQEKAFSVIQWWLIFISLSLVIPGLYIYKFGRRILEGGCFPPPGTKVIRDTPVIKGETARTKGKILAFLGIFFIATGILGAFAIHYFIKSLAGG